MLIAFGASPIVQQHQGKTVLSNFLSDSLATPLPGASEYRPTKGVRIVEIPKCNLWDLSGDKET
jgi:hypothetical protein